MLLRTLFFILFSAQSFAYTVFNLDSSSFSMRKPTEVYIVGFGDTAGDQFMRAALTRAAKHAEIHPDHQQLFIWAKERSKGADVNWLKNRGIKPFEANKRDLTQGEVFHYLKKVKEIKSLHMFTHNAAWYGAGLQETQRLNYNYAEWVNIKNKITGYIFLHGCNTGFVYAPRLSQKLSVPVFGSLGSTDFQQLHSNGYWYYNNEGQSPEGGWSYRNTRSYQLQRSCEDGYCHRLQPDLHHYAGLWGSYKTGLPFYKAFCNYPQAFGGMKKCNAALVDALRTWPSSHSDRLDTWENVETKLTDLLCPNNSSRSVHNDCVETLNAYKNGRSVSNRTYFGNATRCYLSGCDLTIKKILRGDKEAYVDGFFSNDYQNETLIREYQLYKDAFSGVNSRRIPQAKMTVVQ